MKRLIVLICAGLFVSPMMGKASIPGDSIGVKTKNGKTYVLYKITKGDNLSQIAREYGATVSQLQEANGMEGVGLSIDQVIMVPSRYSASTAATATTTEVKPTPPKQHVIQRGESLWAISQTYKVTVEQLQAWNGLVGTSVSAGQMLNVSDPGTKPAAPVKPTTGPVRSVGTVVATTTRETAPQPRIKQRSGRHVVRAGETLYGIARQYGMDTRELKKINRLKSSTVKEGQELTVKAEMPANANQGKSLMKMIDEVEAAAQDSTVADAKPEPVDEFPELEVLTVKKPVMVAPEAKVEVYTDKFTNKQFKRIEERGTAGPIEDLQTDQTKFYAFHKFLPTGSYLRVDYPEKGQSILVEVVNQLQDKDAHAVRLSAKCLDYLMIRQADAPVVLRYVVPVSK